ncbi:MAG: shikimate dehydrogenase [Alphaproteobacteria bacterium]|nr:shikimate dehydrogenase [Alphaproteobacteria bacterium]
MLPKINGQTKWAGVVGWPVSHSKSPLIHNYWCEKYGINATYIPLPVPPEKLPLIIPALAHMGCVGINLTLPHKELVMPHIQYLDNFARTIGAVNTIVVNAQSLRGYNTDAYGFWQNIVCQTAGRLKTGALKKDKAFVVGAGGAARAVVAALDKAGFTTIYVMNRTFSKAQAMQEVSPKVQAVKWLAAANELSGCNLLVNTTSLGMKGQPPLEVAIGKLAPDALVTDIVYTPLKTPLLKAAELLGMPIVDGAGMLLYQAQKAFELWFGVLPDVDKTVREIVLRDTA